MAEKNYIMQAVVPEAPRTIDEQQLHVYVPQGSTDNFGVFKPDGQQFVITSDGILRVDASKLIQLATPSAQVVEDGGETSAEVQFTETDHTLLRQFQFIFKNIKGATGATGATGLAALECSYVKTANKQPSPTEQINIPLNTFNRTPLSGEVATCYYVDSTTSITYLIKAGVISISGDHAICYIDSVLKFTGDNGADGLDALTYSGTYTEEREDGLNGKPINLPLANFSRHPEIADTFLLVYSVTETGNVYIAVMSVEEVGTENVKCALVVGTVNLIRGPKGEQGATGNDGVSITSVTQTGVQGGTQVTITLSNGQSTSFIVYNGINTNFQIVDSLPTENISTSTIYLVPSTKPEAENIYDEYIYVNNSWEHIGSTSIDLSDYVTKTYFNQNVGDATKNYIATQLSGKADASSLNTKLDKVTDGSMLPQAYVKNDDGTQGMADYIPGVFYFNYNSTLTLEDASFVETTVDGWNPSLIGMYYCTSPCILSIKQLTGGVLGNTTIYGVNLSSIRSEPTDSVYFQGLAYKATETGCEYYNVLVQVDASGIILFSTAQKIENAGNKVTAITGTGNDTNYPTTKAVADYVTSKEPYHVELTGASGTLSVEQYNKLKADDNSYILLSPTDVSTQKNKFYRQETAGSIITYCSENLLDSARITILSDRTWTIEEAVVSLFEEITYSALKAKRDAGTLVKGKWYRITDYTCTTIQEDTQSAGHVFDIIVRADSTNVLNENAFAALHSGDTYFANCKLEAWQLKYSLDNDTEKFAWADSTNGKGVIYYMKDEWNNECQYDFKNIQFKRYKIASSTSISGLVGAWGIPNMNDYTVNYSDTQFFYTFAYFDDVRSPNVMYDATLKGNDGTVTAFGGGFVAGVYGNCIAEASAFSTMLLEHNAPTKMVLPGTIIYSTQLYTDGSMYVGCHGNKFGTNCINNTFGDNCINNKVSDNYTNNIIGKDCSSNTFGDDCYNNVIGDGCTNNTFGDNCSYNILGAGFSYNIVGNGCSNNTIRVMLEKSFLKPGVRYVKFTTQLSVTVKHVTVESSVIGTSSSNMLELYDADITNKTYPITITRESGTNGKYLMKWNVNGACETGKYKATATAESWTPFTADMKSTSEGYVDTAIANAITTTLNTPV